MLRRLLRCANVLKTVRKFTYVKKNYQQLIKKNF